MLGAGTTGIGAQQELQQKEKQSSIEILRSRRSSTSRSLFLDGAGAGITETNVGSDQAIVAVFIDIVCE